MGVKGLSVSGVAKVDSFKFSVKAPEFPAKLSVGSS